MNLSPSHLSELGILRFQHFLGIANLLVSRPKLRLIRLALRIDRVLSLRIRDVVLDLFNLSFEVSLHSLKIRHAHRTGIDLLLLCVCHRSESQAECRDADQY